MPVAERKVRSSFDRQAVAQLQQALAALAPAQRNATREDIAEATCSDAHRGAEAPLEGCFAEFEEL